MGARVHTIEEKKKNPKYECFPKHVGPLVVVQDTKIHTNFFLVVVPSTFQFAEAVIDKILKEKPFT